MLKLENLFEHDPQEAVKEEEHVMPVVMVGVHAVDGDLYG